MIVSYLVVLMVGKFSWLMNLCHVSCMVCVVDVIGLGSFMCSWDAGSVSVVARVDRANASLGWGRGSSFACIAVALSLWICVCPDVGVCVSSILNQSFSPSSHRGKIVL